MDRGALVGPVLNGVFAEMIEFFVDTASKLGCGLQCPLCYWIPQTDVTFGEPDKVVVCEAQLDSEVVKCCRVPEVTLLVGFRR